MADVKPYNISVPQAAIDRLQQKLAVVPGLSIFMLVLSFNLVGDGLRDALDPRGR